MRVGILTYHRANNYGAFLQAQALCGRLNQEEDIEAEIIDFSMSVEKKVYSYSRKIKKWIKNPAQIKFDIEQKRMFNHVYENSFSKLSKDRCVSDSISDFEKFVAGKYDVMVAGSDEIWKLDGFRGFPSPYWLPGDLKAKKFAYAASSRSNFDNLTEEGIKQINDMLADYEFIGVRDSSTFESICRYTGYGDKVKICCDPSFLYDFSIPKGDVKDILGNQRGFDPHKKNILLMTANKILARYVIQLLGKKCNVISVFHWNSGSMNKGDVSPWQWLALIRNADLVITTYFHASCYSIIYNTPFMSFGAPGKSSKLQELLFDERLSWRYFQDINSFISDPAAEKEVECCMVRSDYSDIIKQNRREFDFFIQALREKG